MIEWNMNICTNFFFFDRPSYNFSNHKIQRYGYAEGESPVVSMSDHSGTMNVRFT